MQATRYILDTNIWLDWLVFQNDTLDELKAVHANGGFHIIYTSDMLEEFADVISRAQFKLSVEQQVSMLAQLTALAQKVETRETPLNTIRCKDKDDQIFIDTALSYQVDWLLSKDNHLLALRNRASKYHVRIGTIDAWMRASVSHFSLDTQKL